MSGDPTDLLDRATPTAVPSLDYDRLARRGRRHRHLRQAGVSVVALAVVAAGGVALQDARGPSGIEVAGEGASTGDVASPGDVAASPVGAWTSVAEMEAGRNDAFADTTGDGQLVVYGGTPELDGPALRDGLVLDPETGASEAIPPPPIGERPFPFVGLSADRLLVFGGNDGSPDGAYYDLGMQAWTPVPAVPDSDVAPNVRAWDGTTLVVGDTYRMTERAVGNPVLWQWEVGQDSWTRLPDSPLDAGDMSTAVTDRGLAVWTDPVIDDPDSSIDRPGLASDATEGDTRLAVYDFGADAWTAIPRDQLPEVADDGRATIAWQDGDLVAVPLPPTQPYREGPDDRGEAVDLAPPVRYATDTWTATTLEPMPEELQRSTVGAVVGVGRPAVTASDTPVVASAGRLAAALLDDGTWTTSVTASSIDRVGGHMVAIDSPWVMDTPLSAQVWTDGGWQPAADADALARGFAGVTATDDALYLVGGSSLRSPEPGEEPDATPGEEGEQGPYVIDTHRDVLRYLPDM